jgi:aryl sulfotransferase
MKGELNRSGLEDDAIGRPYPAIQVDPGQFFHQWVTKGEVSSHEDGSPNMSFLQFEKTWWEARNRPNVLMVHYNNLQSDLSTEMRRVAPISSPYPSPRIYGPASRRPRASRRCAVMETR